MVKRTVWLEVRHRGRRRLSSVDEVADLIVEASLQVRQRDVETATTEGLSVGVGHLSADGDASCGGCATDSVHGGSVAGMASARDVRARDDLEQKIIGLSTVIEFTDIAVDVDPR